MYTGIGKTKETGVFEKSHFIDFFFRFRLKRNIKGIELNQRNMGIDSGI